MSLQTVIDLARADLGYTEYPPDSNNTKYGERYGLQGQRWCVICQWDWFNRAGERMAFFGGGKTASCGTLLRWYKSQGLTVPVNDVKVGDIVILNFSGTQDTEHCGLVVEVNRRYETKELILIQTIEGNTTPGEEKTKQSNGGCVALKNRYPSQIVGVCRPQYKPEEATVDDVTGHWASASVEWAKEQGLIKGYPDGSFKPDQPITRAEACVIMERLYQIMVWGDDRK